MQKKEFGIAHELRVQGKADHLQYEPHAIHDAGVVHPTRRLLTAMSHAHKFRVGRAKQKRAVEPVPIYKYCSTGSVQSGIDRMRSIAHGPVDQGAVKTNPFASQGLDQGVDRTIAPSPLKGRLLRGGKGLDFRSESIEGIPASLWEPFERGVEMHGVRQDIARVRGHPHSHRRCQACLPQLEQQGLVAAV